MDNTKTNARARACMSDNLHSKNHFCIQFFKKIIVDNYLLQMFALSGINVPILDSEKGVEANIDMIVYF